MRFLTHLVKSLQFKYVKQLFSNYLVTNKNYSIFSFQFKKVKNAKRHQKRFKHLKITLDMELGYNGTKTYLTRYGGVTYVSAVLVYLLFII